MWKYRGDNFEKVHNSPLEIHFSSNINFFLIKRGGMSQIKS